MPCVLPVSIPNSRTEVAVLCSNFRALFSFLGARQRAATRELTEEKVDKKINRLRKAVLAGNPVGATREQGVLLLDPRPRSRPGNLRTPENHFKSLP